jgi:HAD superfamily hydrolase (TIGR01509 family)
VALTTIFLDAGGVLVTPNWTRVSAALAAHDVDLPAGALLAADPRVRRDIDLGLRGTASDQQRGWVYFNLILEHCGVPISARTDAALDDLQTYHSVYNLWESVPDGVPETLDELHRMGLKLVVVSNANGRLKVLFERLGLARRFDVMLDSAEEGIEKPDPRLFEVALARSESRPNETVHVGDLYHVDVEGARAAGLDAVLLDSADLYGGYDCARIRDIRELPSFLRERRAWSPALHLASSFDQRTHHPPHEADSRHQQHQK